MLLKYVVYKKAIQCWSYFNGVDLIGGRFDEEMTACPFLCINKEWL